MRCDEIMKKNVECVSPDDSVQAAATRMRDENVGFLPVCDSSKKVLGTVTDRDLAIRVLAEGAPNATPIKSVMSQEVVSCSPGDDLREAEALMGKHHKSRIMCVEDGQLVGVISLSDIAQSERGARASQTLREVCNSEIRA